MENKIDSFFRLGDGEGNMPVTWKTLNPLHLVQQMKSFNFNFDSFEEFMKMVRVDLGGPNAVARCWMTKKNVVATYGDQMRRRVTQGDEKWAILSHFIQ